MSRRRSAKPYVLGTVAVFLVVLLANLLGIIGASGDESVATAGLRTVPVPVAGPGPLVPSTWLPLVAPAGTTLHTRAVVVGGMRRTSALVLPARPPGGPLPLVVVLAGRGQSPGAAVDLTGLGPLAARGTAALLYPEGLDASWNAGHGCCGPAALRRPDDAAFVAAAVADVQEHVDVDPRRVALVGYSNGGKLAYALTCDPHGPFRALATYGAVPLGRCPGPAPPRPVSYLLAAGTADTVMPLGGRPGGSTPEPAVGTGLGWLRERDGCTGPPAVAGTTSTWRCTNGTRVVLRLYPGHSHAWPSGRDGPPMAAVVDDFLATAAI